MFFRPTDLVIHHSKTKDGVTVSWSAIRKYHTTNPRLMWDDIGYHFGVELVNVYYEVLLGRMPYMQGAHCRAGGMNGKALGLCVVGDFDKHEPPIMQFNLAASVGSWICHVLNIPVENIKGHRDYDSGKSCPGRLFDMEAFRVKVSSIDAPIFGVGGRNA